MVMTFGEWLLRLVRTGDDLIESVSGQWFGNEGAEYSVERLLELAPEAEEVSLSELVGYLGNHIWGKNVKTPLEHVRDESGSEWERILSSDLSSPILIAPNGVIVDGAHRAAKALFLGRETIQARRFSSWEDMEPAREEDPLKGIRTPKQLLDFMGDIEYDNFEDEEEYMVQTVEELLDSRRGVCYDQVELEREVLGGYDPETYFSYKALPIEDNPTHTFLIYREGDEYFWFENSWAEYRGIHGPYGSREEAVEAVEEKLRGGWGSVHTIRYKRPEGEYNLNQYGRKILSSNKGSVLSFGEWLEAFDLQALMGTPERALVYARSVGERVPELEPLILEDPWVAFEYAQYVVGERWLEAEMVIRGDPIIAYQYVTRVARERVPSLEPTLAAAPSWALRYTERILRPWLEENPGAEIPEGFERWL